MKNISIAGSTGSIGRQALEVVKDDSENFKVTAIGAKSNTDLLKAQAEIFLPDYVCLFDETLKENIEGHLPKKCKLVCGQEAIDAVSTLGDLVLNAIVGFAGLSVTLTALKSNKLLALANKESLVAGGDVVERIKIKSSGKIVPVDSEHSAIFQCLNSERASSVDKLILTGSGGPFREILDIDLANITLNDALKHPTWVMGPKITIDSSTLMNKALEIIEAKYLFDISVNRIEVVIHKQSIVHSMVTFKDGATIAQMANPTMCLPIAYALNYPERSLNAYGKIDFSFPSELTFEPPNREIFKSLDFAYEAGSVGKNLPTVVNAANEVAVSAFLNEEIPWLTIFDTVRYCMDNCEISELVSLSDVMEVDENTRKVATDFIKARR